MGLKCFGQKFVQILGPYFTPFLRMWRSSRILTMRIVRPKNFEIIIIFPPSHPYSYPFLRLCSKHNTANFYLFSFHVVRFFTPVVFFPRRFVPQNPPNFLRLPERSILSATNFYPKLFLFIKKLLFLHVPREGKRSLVAPQQAAGMEPPSLHTA